VKGERRGKEGREGREEREEREGWRGERKAWWSQLNIAHIPSHPAP
jgi:hypothetical protein